MFKQNPDIQKMKTRNELYFSKSPVAGSRENIFTSEGAQVAPLGTKIVRQIHKVSFDLLTHLRFCLEH